MRNPTKIVMRHLPPDLTEEEFLDVIQPFINPTNYIRFCSVDKTLGSYGTTRAYIDFSSTDGLYQFKEKFDNYVFVDSKGNESYGLVEYAVNQKIPDSFSNGKSKRSSSNKTDKRRPNTKLGSISKDLDYLTFEKELEAAKQSGDSANIASGDGAFVARGQAQMEANLEEIKAREKELESSHGVTNEKTPLLLYLEQKRNERQMRRDEERRRVEERRKEIRSRPADLFSAKRKEKVDRDKNRALDIHKDKSVIDKFGKNSRKVVEEKSSSKKEKPSIAYKDEEQRATRSSKQTNKPSRVRDEGGVKTKETDTTSEASAAVADSSSVKESVPDNKPAGKPTNKTSREYNKPASKSYAKSRAAAANEDNTKEKNRPHAQEDYDDKTRRRPDSYYGHRTHYEDDYPRYGGGRGGRGRGGASRPTRSYDYDYDYDDYSYNYDYGYDYKDRRDRDYGDDHGESGYSRGRGDRGRHKPTSYSTSRKDGGRGGR